MKNFPIEDFGIGIGWKFSIRHTSIPLSYGQGEYHADIKTTQNVKHSILIQVLFDIIRGSKFEGYAFCPAPWKAGSKSLMETDILWQSLPLSPTYKRRNDTED